MSSSESEAARIFLEAVERHDPEHWPVFVQQACAGNPELLDRVTDLLQAHEKSNRLLDQGSIAATLDVPPLAERPGAQIGPYKLLQQIGEGGMGIVYVAAQTEPLRRKVALKIIKPGMDTREVVARFEAERQVLALMDHPNIAKVFDAGATEAGRPYFVMELVQGIPITEYCDQQRFTTRQRLELFVTLCYGVQHAHQKGVIHRDLKPSNLLVEVHDVRPVPKIIDFGVAKAMGQQLTAQSLHTSFDQMVGTPLYMSPEQAGQCSLDVDTRSDIYSLGVVLYELLTGHTPFERDTLRAAGADELRRIIREVDPPRPSTRVSTLQAADLSTISERRHMEPRKLCEQLRGDLDWIVVKALQKDRTRRYQTANGFAQDIQRYLNHEPIEARRPSRFDRAAKWARRHQSLVWSVIAALTLTLISLAVSIVLIAGAYTREKEQRQSADQQRARVVEREGSLRHYLYAADLRLAREAWKNAELQRAVGLLSRHCPGPGETDLRGFEWYYLRGLCQQELRTLRGHTGEVYGLAFSPDGKTLASASQDGTVNLWDAATQQLRRTLVLHAAEAAHVALSPDGTIVAATGDDGMVKLWETATGKETGILTGHTEDVFAAVFSPDGQLLATGGSDDTVKLWNVQTLREEATLHGHTGDVQSLAFAPDGRTLASASSDTTVKLWDVASRKERASFDAHWKLTWITFSPDGQIIATASQDRTVRLWHVADLSESRCLQGHTNWVHCVAFSPDGERLVSASRDGSVRIWNVATGELLNVLRGHTGRVWNAAFSPDGHTLATSGGDRTIKLWDPTARPDCQRGPTSAGIFKAMAFAPDGTLLVSTETDVTAWDPQSDPEASKSKWVPEPTAGADFSPDCRTVAIGNMGGRVGLWNAVNGNLEAELGKHGTGTGAFPVSRVVFSADGGMLATSCGVDNTLKVWDVPGRRETIIVPFQQAIYSIAMGPDAHTLAVGLDNGMVKFIDVDTGREQQTLPGDKDDYVRCLAFSPNGAILATAGDDRVIRLWDTATAHLRQTLVGHSDWVESLAFSPDGKTLTSGSRDGTLRFWSAASGHELLCLDAPIGIEHLAFSRDGKHLAGGGNVAGQGGEIYVWSAGGNLQAAAELAGMPAEVPVGQEKPQAK